MTSPLPRAADDSRYKWFVVALLWLVCFFNYADRQALFSVFPLLKSSIGLTDVELGVAGGAFMWAYALFGPFAGWLGDRLARKRIILAALVFWSVFTAASGLAHNLWQLTACRALAGLGEAFYFPAAMSLISDYHSGATRSRAMALHQTGVYIGTIAGGAAAGWFAERLGWRMPFVIFGALGAALAILLLALLREPRRGASDAQLADPNTASLGRVLRDIAARPAVRFLILAFIGANFVAAVFLSWMPSFLFRKFGMTLSMAGFSATAYLQTASVAGVFTGGALADRFARRRPSARIAVQAAGLLSGAPFLFLTGFTLSIPVLILAMTCFGYCKGLYDANIFAGLYEAVPVARRAAAAGLLNSLGWLGAGFAPILIADLSARFTMSACLSATSVLYLICAALLVFAARAVKPLKPSL